MPTPTKIQNCDETILDEPLRSAAAFTFKVERLYAGMILLAPPDESGSGQEPSLGGSLVYAGELDAEGRPVVVAGNVAGAASLAASADPAAQKEAIRDGIVDFVVTSLDEALRILKNEIRKREAVAVCVAKAPLLIEREMHERGVQPDLLVCGLDEPELFAAFLEGRGKRFSPKVLDESQARLTWTVAAGSVTQALSRLDAMVLEWLAQENRPDVQATQRWLRLAPRYLGKLGRWGRTMTSEPDFARAIADQIEDAVKSRKIAVPIRMNLCEAAGRSVFEATPPGAPEKKN